MGYKIFGLVRERYLISELNLSRNYIFKNFLVVNVLERWTALEESEGNDPNCPDVYFDGVALELVQI